MTDFLFSHSNELLGVLSLSAVIGWILVNHSLHATKTIASIFAIALILFIPLAFHYEYVFVYTYHILIVICLSCAYFLLSTLLEKYQGVKAMILTTMISAGVIFFLMLSAVCYLQYLVAEKSAYKRPEKYTAMENT